MPPRPSDILEAIRQARQDLDDLERLTPQLHELYRQAAPGYSADTSYDRQRGPTRHTIDGEPVELTAVEAAADRSDHDPVRRSWRAYTGQILNARNTLRHAKSEALKHIDPHQPDLDPTVWCEHCLDHGVHNPAEKHRVLCAACRTYWHRHHERRPRHLILADE